MSRLRHARKQIVREEVGVESESEVVAFTCDVCNFGGADGA